MAWIKTDKTISGMPSWPYVTSRKVMISSLRAAESPDYVPARFSRLAVSIFSVLTPHIRALSATRRMRDLRSTAFLQPSKILLDQSGLWDHLAPYAMPLQKMRIMDASGDITLREFDAADLNGLPFGWNLPNWVLKREISRYVDALSNVTLINGVGCSDKLSRERETMVQLSDGTRVSARLVIAADGRNSPLRERSDIGLQTIRFGQKALAFAVSHALPHNNISTEIHRSGGPFTLVPLPDHLGRPSSAVVWMEDGPNAKALMDLPVTKFNAAMTERSAHILGPLEIISRRSIWPIIAQHADRLVGQRLALIAEAAHVVPPIGAQGLNMSLTDIGRLADLATADPDALGNADMLHAYERARLPDIKRRISGIALLNRASQSHLPLMQFARAEGLKALHDIAPLRTGLMQLGLGGSS